jgi:hypothetical protein
MLYCVYAFTGQFNSLGVGLLDTYAGGFAAFETYGHALASIGLVPTLQTQKNTKNRTFAPCLSPAALPFGRSVPLLLVFLVALTLGRDCPPPLLGLDGIVKSVGKIREGGRDCVVLQVF